MATMKTTGRRVAIGAGAIALVVVTVLVATQRRDIEARWLLARLERARTEEEARPALERLTAACADLEMAQRVVGLIGRGQQYGTFWVFRGIVRNPSTSPAPLIRALGDRLDRDPVLVAWWRQFHIWSDCKAFGAMSVIVKSFDGLVSGRSLKSAKPSPEWRRLILLAGYAETDHGLEFLAGDLVWGGPPRNPQAPPFTDWQGSVPELAPLTEIILIPSSPTECAEGMQP
jgi:hypothetical protein